MQKPGPHLTCTLLFVFFWLSVGCPFVFFRDFLLIWGFSTAIHTRIDHYFLSYFFWVLTWRQPTEVSWPLSAKLPFQLKPLVTPLVCWLHEHFIKQLYIVNCFPVLDPYRLVISFIAFINIICCLKNTYIKPCKWDLFSFWRCFKTNVIMFIIVIIFNIVILFIHNRNRAGGK